jgi:hypothetical protein
VGFPIPIGGGVEFSWDSYILSGLCMEKNGFLYEINNKKGFCNIQRTKNCDAGRGDIPQKNIETRMASSFCKEFPRADICQEEKNP